ncbi:hypothetical protein ACFQ4C_15030 [Larkinella insperata]|uniref:Lipoprotein SmpA/OmlA domain-containing protein n=1 Tax=Larkinella insperata TaxID=332158 RepID=A0ABW3Q8S0_9BACT|nr:hypothetical protein [Larkinella insperata]
MNQEDGVIRLWRWFGRFSSSLLLVYSVLVVSGCSAPPDRLGPLDLVKWRSDRNGCQGVRTAQINDFKAVRQELKGESANEIGKILGRPDNELLDDRNQKFYIYFLESGPQCQDPKLKTQSRSVALRISAIGYVTEITFQRGRP